VGALIVWFREKTAGPLHEGSLIAFMRGVNPKSFIVQLAVVFILAFFLHWVIDNTVSNLTRLQIASGFDFLNMRAGVGIPDTLISYTEDSTYRRAMLAGFVNTVFLAAICIVTASMLGLTIAFGRLSQNWLLRKLCLIYVEVFRNLPLLLVILFWYFGILQQILPSVRESFVLPFHIYINQRGIYFPAFHWQGGGTLLAIILAGIVLTVLTAFLVRKKKQPADGKKHFPAFYFLFPLLLLSAIFYLIQHFGRFDIPQWRTFNIVGGASISPEFLALFLALSFYTAALISEIIRAGIEGVDSRFKEAGASLGLHSGLIARLVTLPLALRTIIPMLSSQYMSLIKNTSLAVALGYSDIMRVGNTVLNQTGQAVEVVVIWMLTYLGLCLVVSVFMNWLNRKMALVER